MDNKLNVQKLGYEVGEPMWVHWDDRYVLRGGHILGKCPDDLYWWYVTFSIDTTAI